MQSTDRNQLWSPGQSLWSLIAEHAPGSELPKIHAALGHSLVDMYTEVHAEAVMWYKMWQGSQQGGNYSSSRAGTPLPLADPPVVKELVRAEVRMLLQNLKERAIREGRDDEEFLFRYKPETVNYALGHLDSCTDLGDNDNESRPSSNCSVQSNAEDEIDTVKDKLNVADIDKVVDHLKSVLTEECKALKKQVKHLQGNIRQKCELDKTEPTLAELRELRGAIQTDLELYPSSFASSYLTSSPLPVKALKNRFRLSAGQRACDKTLQALTTTSVLRPHPPPALRHVNPIPPVGPPLIQNSINTSSLSRTHGQHRSTSASAGSSKTQTTVSNRIVTSGHRNAYLTTCGTDKKMVKHLDHCNPERDSAGLHRRTPTSSSSFQIKTQRNSPVQAAHLSSHRAIHSPGRECDLSPQTARNSSLAPSSRNINIIPSAVPALSPLCDAGSYSSNSADHSVSTTGKSTTQNGPQNSTRGGSSVSTTVQTHNDRKSTTESFHSYVTEKHSVLSETGRPPAQNCTMKRNNGIYRNKNGHLREDVSHQQRLSSHCLTNRSSCHPESSGTHPKPKQINGQFFTSPKRPLEGTTSQPKRVQEAQKEQEFLNRFFQPVPPARVPT
ncbi:coiled-coil domain-containing protein 24 [Thunnus thynnus]|uniref:coiled-coil domain-containing protein 24 n=1 Tax=Thunnus thynnus TaxID=8237 RepID=UPI0035297655